MLSLLRKLEDYPLLATVVMVGATAAYAGVTGEFFVRAVEAHDTRPRCYLVAYQRQGKLWVDSESSVQNSRLCVPGALGSRQVVEAIQTQLQTAMRSSKSPASAVILNILPAGES
jgi:hypothetical protein